jgi:L-ascorbate metabolism protein UlaG (beta-lactamase superfamily)
VRVTHLGHSCLLVEAGGVRVLLDPGTLAPGFDGVTGLDAVLVTHQHPDHVDVDRLPALLAANPGARLLAEPQTAGQLAGSGLDAEPVAAGDVLELGGLRVEAAGGRHAVIHADLPRIGNVGYLLAAGGGPVLFHPGDMVDTAPEGVDVLALPLNAPWAAAKETVAFARAVAPRAAFPIHDGLLSPAGRAIYLRVVGGLLPPATRLDDLAGAGAVGF